MTEMAVRDDGALRRRRFDYEPEQVRLIKETVARDATDAELGMFLELSARYGLDPFAKEIWCVKGQRQDGSPGRLLIMIGRDGLRKLARRAKARVDQDVVREQDTFKVSRAGNGGRAVEHGYNGSQRERGGIVGAWCEVVTEDSYGFFYAPLEEYLPTSEAKLRYSPWGSQQSVMILAAAERQALRQAIPLSGVLVEGEMDLNEERAQGAPGENVEVRWPSDAARADLEPLFAAINAASPHLYGPGAIDLMVSGQSLESLSALKGRLERQLAEMTASPEPEEEVVADAVVVPDSAPAARDDASGASEPSPHAPPPYESRKDALSRMFAQQEQAATAPARAQEGLPPSPAPTQPTQMPGAPITPPTGQTADVEPSPAPGEDPQAEAPGPEPERTAAEDPRATGLEPEAEAAGSVPGPTVSELRADLAYWHDVLADEEYRSQQGLSEEQVQSSISELTAAIDALEGETSSTVEDFEQLRGDGTDGLYRQSTLASYDACPLATHWRLEARSYSGPEAAAGTLMHAVFGEALRRMRAQEKDRISPDDILGILAQQLATPGAPHVPARYLRNVRIACVKWALDNVWSTQHIVEIEQRLYAPLVLPGGEVVQFTGQPDALLAEPPGGAIVIDYKLTLAVPPKSSVSNRGYFQQRGYGLLVLETYPGLDRCTLREQYPLTDDVREATLYRGDLDEVRQELVADIVGLEHSKQTGKWEPQAGAHCRYCPRPAHCPIEPEQRREGALSNLEVARRSAEEWVVAEATRAQRTRALKGWVSDNGPLVIRGVKGEAVVGWKIGDGGGRSFGLHRLGDDIMIEGLGTRMLQRTDGGPAWAKGYDVAELKRITAMVAEHDKGMIHGAYGRYSETDLVGDLEAGQVEMGPLDEQGRPVWLVAGRALPRKQGLKDFTGSVRMRFEPGVAIITRMAWQGQTGQEPWRVVLEAIRYAGAQRPLAVGAWQEHEGERALVSEAGLELGAVKIAASSDMRGIYVSPSLTPPPYAPEQQLGLGRLPMILSSAHLEALIEQVEGLGEYAQHYSSYNKGGTWTALALRGFYDEPERIEKPAEMGRKWKSENAADLEREPRDTPLREQLSAVEPILGALPCAFYERIRLMQLAPGGGELERHADITDAAAGAEEGRVVRLHIPLITNPQVRFCGWDLEGRQRAGQMKRGGVYYLDTRKPHTAVNGGETPRVHLVADVIANAETVKALAGAREFELAEEPAAAA